MVELYTLRHTPAQLEAFLDAALESARESVHVSRSFEGSSMTFDPATAKQVALDLGYALKAKRAEQANTDPVLTAGPWSTGVDLSTRQIE